MAIHEYGCRGCENIWEIIILSADDIPLTCPDCGSGDIHQYISWRGMYTGEHKKAWDRPAPSNKTTVSVTSNTKGKAPK